MVARYPVGSIWLLVEFAIATLSGVGSWIAHYVECIEACRR